MPQFISKLGEWVPAEEYHVNPNAKPGENPVYKGPDRAAVEMLKEQGVEKLGQPYNTDPELVIRARQLGFKDVDEYLRTVGWDKNKAVASAEKASAELHTHADPARKQPIRPDTGGRDYSMQGNDRHGGIGKLPNDVPAAFTKPE